MGGETAFGGNEVVTLMQRTAAGGAELVVIARRMLR
jgi:hypothetical protein